MLKISAKNKGDALEAAVRAIESVILRSFPGFSEGTFKMEAKKILIVDGVRHEFDLHVAASLAVGYDAIFIFECKNWAEKVGKNEIIVFSQKIKVANAQKGFFVATGYTEYAVAQAALDPRMELKVAEELAPELVMVPFEFHGIEVVGTKAAVSFDCGNPGVSPTLHSMDMLTATFVVRGAVVDLDQFIRTWISDLSKRRADGFPSGAAEEGIHTLNFDDERDFENGDAILNDRKIRRVRVAGTVDVKVSKAVVVSAFDVVSRGRMISTRFELPSVRVVADFVATN
jgi:hypothetical protein